MENLCFSMFFSNFWGNTFFVYNSKFFRSHLEEKVSLFELLFCFAS